MNAHKGIKFFMTLILCNQINARTITILPLGDSITWGMSSGQESPPIQGGYRAPLLEALQQAGQAVQFIGPRGDNATQQQIQQGQQWHAGFSGYRADELSAGLDGKDPYGQTAGFWLTGQKNQPGLDPDIILLMAGTNDILVGLGAQGAAYNMENLIIKIRTLRPNAAIIVAQITPLYAQNANQVAPYNARLKALVSKYQQLGSHITLVDQYTPLLPFAKQFSDKIHPDAITYRAMALAWMPKVLGAIWNKIAAGQ